jgi:hypothetical protein
VTWWARPLKAEVATLSDRKLRTLFKTIRAYTRPIATRRLDSPKHCIQTQVVGMPIIRVTHDAVDLKTLAVPLACPMRWAVEGCHGPLPGNTTGVATWLDAREPSRGGDLIRKRSVVQVHPGPPRS